MKPLTVAVWVSLGALAVALIGIVLDHTPITGAPAWAKPAKFGISIAVYCGTLGWMLSHVTGHDTLVRAVSWATALCLVVELALIDLQVIRGTTSHFNLASPFDATVTAVMGGAVVVVFLAAVTTAGVLLGQHGLPVWLSYGIGGGLAMVILGMAEAVLMVTNTNGPSAGGHTVGAPDGGPGLPFLGWSTQHGDLRVAHFVGLHGLQAIPLTAWALHRVAPHLGDGMQKLLIVLATVGYAGLVVLLAWQAEQGRPLLRLT